MSAFWNFVTRFTAGTLAKAEDVNTNLDGIDAGLALVETEIDKAVQITNGAGVTDIVLSAAARANKLLAFDANGDIAASTILGDWKGNHAAAAGTDYQIRDVVKDSTGALGLNNLYICISTHTSTGTLLTDTANWELLVDAAVVAAAQVTIADAGALITATDVEGALQEAFGEIDANTAAVALRALLAGGNTFTGTQNLSDGILQRPKIQDYGAVLTSPSSSSGVLTLDYSLGNVFVVTLTENITSIVITNPPATGVYGEMIIKFIQDAATLRTIAWAAAYLWPYGVDHVMTPTLSAIDWVTLRTTDGGTTWFCDSAQAYA